MRLAWLTVALLWPVALLNYLDRQMLASMKGSITEDIARHRDGGELGLDSGAVQMDVCVFEPVWRILCRPLQPAVDDLR